MALTEQQIKSKQALDKIIDKAIQKVNGTKENDLCKYLPGPDEGYIHHFTLRKLKNSDPDQLFALLQKFIIESDTPQALEPKPRAPRGSRKRRDFINFTRTDIERVLELARQVGDDDLVSRFSPRRSLPTLKRELIRTIRDNKINQELWNAYSETIATIEAAEAYSDTL